MSKQPAHNTIGSAMATGSLGIMASRLSGLVRDIFFAKFWGTGNAIGAFFVAFTIPNLFRRIFGEGALSEAFIPLFNDTLTKSSRREAYLLASKVLTIVAVILISTVGIGIALCLILRSLVSGELAQLTLGLLPWLLPYTVFICVIGILTGILNSLNHYWVPAYSSIILNVFLIIAVVSICPRLGSTDEARLPGLAGAVIAAGVVQLLVFVPVLRTFNFRYTFCVDLKSPQIRKLFRLFVPGVFGASINQINVLFDRLFAAFLGGYAVTSLYYSERIIYLPIGIFGVALAAACLPVFSRAAADNKTDEMIAGFFYALRQIFYLTVPCVIVLFIIGVPIIDLLYRWGSFDAQSSHDTVSAMLYYAPGIPAFAAAKILRAGFFSRQDMVTPMKIGCVCLGTNVILNLIFMIPLKQCGLALATTLSSYINVILLSTLFFRTHKGYTLPIAAFARSLVRIGTAGIAAGAVMFLLTNTTLLPDFGPVIFQKLQNVFLPLVCGGLIYLVVSLVIGSEEPRELLAAFTHKLRKV